jgi:hypothetical protein
MTIRDLKYLLRDYERILLCDYDTFEIKDINEYKQQGRKIKVVTTAYNLNTAVVYYNK